MAPKFSVADAVKYVGTAAESTEMLVLEPVSTVTMPAPALRILPLNSARLSSPPVVSQAPPVAVQVYMGIELTGNAVTPDAAVHRAMHASVKL